MCHVSFREGNRVAHNFFLTAIKWDQHGIKTTPSHGETSHKERIVFQASFFRGDVKIRGPIENKGFSVAMLVC